VDFTIFLSLSNTAVIHHFHGNKNWIFSYTVDQDCVKVIVTNDLIPKYPGSQVIKIKEDQNYY
jgi:hypothetical protein